MSSAQKGSTSAAGDYCYVSGYDAASGNYEPSTTKTVAQGVDSAICEITGHGSGI